MNYNLLWPTTYGSVWDAIERHLHTALDHDVLYIVDLAEKQSYSVSQQQTLRWIALYLLLIHFAVDCAASFNHEPSQCAFHQ